MLHDGPLAGEEVPHVHVHVMPRTKGDGGRCAGMAAFPDAPPMGSVEPDFAALGALSEKLQAAGAIVCRGEGVVVRVSPRSRYLLATPSYGVVRAPMS